MTAREEFGLRRIHIAADLLDARCSGKHLDDVQVLETFDCITQQVEHLSPDIGKLFSNATK